MITKEMKEQIIKEYGRTEGEYRISGSTGSSSYSKNQ